MTDIQHLVRLAQKLAREADRASRTGGRRELDALQETAEQYLKLYRELKDRGAIE